MESGYVWKEGVTALTFWRWARASRPACLIKASALLLDWMKGMWPEQVLEQPNRKPELTRDDRIVKAVMTGKGLRQAAQETAEMSVDENSA